MRDQGSDTRPRHQPAALAPTPEEVGALAEAIIATSRDLARVLPPPREEPYFALDCGVPFDLRVLDAFCSRGIFRKYEFALEVGSGLGGRARWLAARSGCRIVGVDPLPSMVAAAARLNGRTGMAHQVGFQVGNPEQLPLQDRLFTHAWIVAVGGEPAWPGCLREAFRVLRPGAHLALQTGITVRAEDLREVLRGAGFVDIEARRVPTEEPSHACRVARHRLQGWRPAPGVLNLVEPASLAPECLQMFARRPA